jgi:MoxR-like ATPase
MSSSGDRISQLLDEFRNSRDVMLTELGKAVIGQREVLELILAAIFTRGHCLLVGVPGLAKTLIVSSMARILDVGFKRIQFTPDLMPSDITGHSVLDPSTRGESGIGTLRVHQGPVFTHLLLADEINRAPAKTQSALLEVMQEYQVTLEGRAMPLPRPFMVMATQNPIDTEGTYPLPEAQLDRFLLKINIAFPSHAEEKAVVQLTTGQRAGNQLPLDAVRPCLDDTQVLELQRLASLVQAHEQVIDYAVRIARATRDWPGLSSGAGPRGTMALVRAARASALMDGRDFITPDDVARQTLPALRHRVMISPDAQLEGLGVDDLLRSAQASVQAPRL